MKQKKQSVRIGAVYSRVSVDDGVLYGSKEQQVKLCEQKAERLSAEKGVPHVIKYTLIEEKGISGKNARRPKFQELMDLVRGRKIDFIIAKEISRLSRSTRDFSIFSQLCKENNVALYVHGLDLDPNTPMGHAFFHILAVLAEFEREMIIQRVKSSVLSARLNHGKMNGGTVPLGFDHDPKRKGFWVPNRKELQQVEWLMRTFLETGAIKGTLNEARKVGIKNKKGTEFTASSLRRLLTNRKFIGKLRVQLDDESKEVVDVDLHHGPLLSQELFEDVQKRLEDRDRNSRFINRNGLRIYPLTGLLKAEDGTPFAGQSGTSRTGEKYFYYWNGKNKLRLDAAETEKAILTFFRSSFHNDARLGAILRELRGSRVSKVDFITTQIASVRADLSKLDQEEKTAFEGLKELAASSGAGSAVKWLEDQARKQEERRKGLNQELASLERQKMRLEEVEVSAKSCKGLLEGIFKRLDASDPVRQRNFYREIFKHIVVFKDDKMKLVWGIPASVTGGNDVAAENEWWAL